MVCPLCHFRSRQLLYPSTVRRSSPFLNQYLCTSNSYGQHGPIYRCLNCSLVFIVDNTSVKSIISHYQAAADPLYVSEQPARRRTFARHLHRLSQFHSPGRILDIGAYTGLFLDMAREAGWRIGGIEPSRWAVDQARKNYRLSLKNGILKSGYFSSGSFDAVTMWDVIEHFVDPFQALRVSYSYLKSGGILAMSTINIDSPAAKLLGPRWPWLMRMHRVYFSKHTLRLLLEKAGFTHIVFSPHIRYISLRYLLSRFSRWHPRFLGDLVVPFYIGDLFDVYARKPAVTSPSEAKKTRSFSRRGISGDKSLRSEKNSQFFAKGDKMNS